LQGVYKTPSDYRPAAVQ